MLPTSRPCQQPYDQSIMSLDDPCDADRMASVAEYEPKNLYAPMATKCVCACDCVFVTFKCMYTRATGFKESKETPDPERSTRNVRHYPVELSTPPFISIKTCNNDCTFSRNCILPFGSVQLDCGMGEGIVSAEVFSAPFPLFVVVSSLGLWSANMLQSY